MNLQLNQIKELSKKQGFEKINIRVSRFNGVSINFRFRAEYQSNDIDYALLVTQKNEIRFFKSIDSAYKLVSSLLDKEKDLFVDVVISEV